MTTTDTTITVRSANEKAWTYGVPAINVKHHFYWQPGIAKKYRGSDHEFGDDLAFFDWADREDDADGWDYPHGSLYRAEELVRENAWADAQDAATDIWPQYRTKTRPKKVAGRFVKDDHGKFVDETYQEPVMKVWSQGRSGGWLIVEGLTSEDFAVEDWDAERVAEWGLFASRIQDILDDLDYQFVWHLHVNVYEQLTEGIVKI